VIRGRASLSDDRDATALGAGELSVVHGGAAPSYALRFNAARLDAFERWSADRRDDRRSTRSAQYLPDDLRMYGGDFDRDGSWQYESPYGYVWYPTVAATWRPYYDGYWAPLPVYGWTWVGARRWAWPTHHYGRWGTSGHRWFWIPGRRWAPAWVSWGAAPGYVSWCPLGFDDRPVFSFAASFGTRRDSFSAWVVLPRQHFGQRHARVTEWAVGIRSLPARTAFVQHASAPLPPPRSAVRRIVGRDRTDRSGVRMAVPRDQAPSAVRRWQVRPSEDVRTLPQRPSSSRARTSPGARADSSTSPAYRRAVPRRRAVAPAAAPPRSLSPATPSPRGLSPAAPSPRGLSPAAPSPRALSPTPRARSRQARPARVAPGASGASPSARPAAPAGRTRPGRVAPRAAAPSAPAAPRATAPSAAAPRHAVPRARSGNSTAPTRRGAPAARSDGSGSSGQRHSRRPR
jgi:hypothetical protein